MRILSPTSGSPACCSCCCSVAKSCLTLCNPQEVDSGTTGSSVVHYFPEFLKFLSIESVMPLTLLCCLLLLPSIFPSIRVFSNELVLNIRGPKYWNFSLGISPFNEYSGLISFRIDWFDLFAVQGIFKSLVQHHSLINSSALSLLDAPNLTSIHDFWK